MPWEHTIIVRQDVYDVACEGVRRDRFTLAHELGHYLLHPNPGLARQAPVARESIPVYRSSEWQADYFAGSLLMPIELVKTCTSLEEIQERFGVSRDTARTHCQSYRREGLIAGDFLDR